MTPSESPPPYTPHDPNPVPSPERRTSPQPGEEPAGIRLSLRGGFLSTVPQDVESVTSPIAYFEERNFEPDRPLPLMVVDIDIDPSSTREDLPCPIGRRDRRTRNVTDQDWATFVNYLLTELGSDEVIGNGEKGRRWGSMTPEEFYRAKLKMETIVGEWNAAFFMPRSIHFNARFSFIPQAAPSLGQTPTEPSDSPYECLHGVSEPGSVYSTARPPPSAPPSLPPPGPFSPQLSMQVPGPFSSPFGPSFDPRHRCGPWGFRGRGGGRGWAMHHNAAGMPSSRGGFHPWFRPSDPPNSNFGQLSPVPRQARSNSSSSSSSNSDVSSISSDSSISSLSASSISGVDAKEVQRSVTAFRVNPNRKSHLRATVQALHSELRAKKQMISSETAPVSKEAKTWKKENKRSVRSELRALKEEVRSIKKERSEERRAGKRARNADKRSRKAEKQEAKRKQRIQGQSSESIRASVGLDSQFLSGQQRPVIPRADGHLPPSNEIENVNLRHGSEPPGSPLDQLSRLDRQLEMRACHLERSAQHWENQVQHWERQIQHLTQVCAQQDPTAQAPEILGESHHAGQASNPHSAERVIEARRKLLQKSEQSRQKTLAKAESNRQKLNQHKAKCLEMAATLRTQAAELRSKMNDRGSNSTQPSLGYAGASRGFGSNYWEQMGKQVGDWGERFGKDMETWGERFGRDMEAWGKRVEDWGRQDSRET